MPLPLPEVPPQHKTSTHGLNENPAPVRTITVTVNGEVERTGDIPFIEGITLKGLLDAVRPKPGAYVAHADYSYVLLDGDEIHVPANLTTAGGRVVLTDESILHIRIRSRRVARPVLSEEMAKPLININRADAKILQTLPRIGKETAKRIIAERESRGYFKHKEDLLRVKGIGRKMYQWIEPLITVE